LIYTCIVFLMVELRELQWAGNVGQILEAKSAFLGLIGKCNGVW
jgi:hypothetical protein